MIKKLFYAMMAGAMLFATSCQNGVDEVAVVEKSAVVSFSVNTPSLSTRAYGEGTLATQLQYAVYNEDGSLVEGLGENGVFTVDNFSGVATIDLALVNGNKYQVVFWAAAPNAPYTFDAADAEVVVDYTAVTSNNEAYDAFFAATGMFKVEGNIQESVTLRRPFAQINIGASDVEQAATVGIDLTNSAVTVAKAYNTLNLKTGIASGEQVVEFHAAPAATDVFPVAGYEYIAMNYVLVNADKGLLESVSFTCDSYTRTVTNVPVQRNYRTNIFGQLFTNNVEINIDLDQELDFNTPDEQVFYAFQHGGEVKLTQNMEIKSTLVVASGVNAVLNLNGKTLKNNVDNDDTDVIVVKEGATLTINGEGIIEAVTGNDGYAIIADGTVIINGGTIKSGVDAAGDPNAVVYARGNGVVKVNGGYFPNDNKSKFVLNKRDADIATATIEVKGGTFENFDPANNAADRANTNYCAEGYISLAEGDVYTVVEGAMANDKAEWEALLSDADTDLISLACGLEYASDQTVSIEKDLEIYANGKTIKAGAASSLTPSVAVAGAYSVTLHNANVVGGFIGAYYGANVIVNGGSLKYKDMGSGRNCFYAASTTADTAIITIKDVDVDMDGASGNTYLCAHGNAIIHVEGGNFHGKSEGSSHPYVKEASFGSYEGQVIITGGTFNFDPTAWVAAGYEATKNGSTWTVSAE